MRSVEKRPGRPAPRGRFLAQSRKRGEGVTGRLPGSWRMLPQKKKYSSVFFTWGSVALIGYISIYFKNSLSKRLLGAASAAVIFFILSNFGVWISGGYGYTLNGLISCYILAIPFFGNTFVSTIIYSALIELIYKIYNTRFQREG